MNFLDCSSAQDFLKKSGLTLEEALEVADRELDELRKQGGIL